MEPTKVQEGQFVGQKSNRRHKLTMAGSDLLNSTIDTFNRRIRFGRCGRFDRECAAKGDDSRGTLKTHPSIKRMADLVRCRL